MDEVRIWNVARSAADIQGTMGGPLATPAANLIGRWALNEGTGHDDRRQLGPRHHRHADQRPDVGGRHAVRAHAAAGGELRREVRRARSPAGDYATFGAAPNLGAATFTIETWFRRDGAGVVDQHRQRRRRRHPARDQGARGRRSQQRRHELLPRHPRHRTACSSPTSRRARQAPVPGLNHPVRGRHADCHRAGRSRPTPTGTTPRHLRRHDDASLSGRRLEQTLVVSGRRAPTASSTRGWARPSHRPASPPGSSPARSTRRASGTTRAAPRRSLPARRGRSRPRPD